eukprot:365424-Chlamydomonas_euryale.AAC.38
MAVNYNTNYDYDGEGLHFLRHVSLAAKKYPPDDPPAPLVAHSGVSPACNPFPFHSRSEKPPPNQKVWTAGSPRLMNMWHASCNSEWPSRPRPGSSSPLTFPQPLAHPSCTRHISPPVLSHPALSYLCRPLRKEGGCISV